MRLNLSTWPEVEDYLQTCATIIVPMGSIEQHGPNGLIGTDAICAESVAVRAGDIGGFMVAPTLAYGVAPFNLGFPGTVSLRARTFTQMLLDCLHSLHRHGFTHIYCLNGHGGNIAPTMSAFSELYADASFMRNCEPPPKCRLVSWWQYSRTDSLRKELYGDDEGLHATPSEVAMTQFTHPHAAHPMSLGPVPRLTADDLRTLGGDAHFDAAQHRRRYPDGRIGSAPNMATPEHGGSLLELAANEAAADVTSFAATDPTA
jgi:creatinine amidohydrolase